MTLLKDNNYKEINVALLSLEADIKNKIAGFDTSVIDKQLAEINSRIDKINDGSNNTSDEIEDINSKLNRNSNKIKNIEQNIEDIDTRIDDIEQKLSDIFSAENKVTDFNTTTNSGIYYWVIDAANRPTDYGVLLVNKYDGGDSATSIWVNQVAYGTNNKIYFRQNINSGNWTDWKAVAFVGGENATLTVNGKTYNGSEAVDAGVQKIENGGTGVTTQADINKAFIGNLEVGTSDVTDGTEFVSSWASDNGFAETAEGALNKPYKRQFVKVWNYIKGKISSVLGLTKDNYGGNASTAGKASFLDEYVGAGGTRLTSGNIVPKDSSEWGGMRKDVVTSSMTDSGRPGVDGHLLTMFWDNSARYDSQLYISNDVGVSPTLKVRQKQNEADYGPWTDIITSNNIGSQTVASAGNAGTADTAGTANYAKNMYYQNLDLSSLDKTKFYPLVCVTGNNFAEVAIYSEGGYASIDYNQNRIHFDISTYGWNDLPPTLNIREYACYENNEITIGCIGRGIRYGSWAIWLRGGIHYTCFTRDCDLSLKTSGYTYGDETYTVGTNYYGGSNSYVEVWFTPQSTITDGSYSTRTITAPNIKANSKMIIPIGAPSSLEDGCIWIER